MSRLVPQSPPFLGRCLCWNLIGTSELMCQSAGLVPYCKYEALREFTPSHGNTVWLGRPLMWWNPMLELHQCVQNKQPEHSVEYRPFYRILLEMRESHRGGTGLRWHELPRGSHSLSPPTVNGKARAFCSPEVSITVPPASLMMTVAAARSQQCNPNW